MFIYDANDTLPATWENPKRYAAKPAKSPAATTPAQWNRNVHQNRNQMLKNRHLCKANVEHLKLLDKFQIITTQQSLSNVFEKSTKSVIKLSFLLFIKSFTLLFTGGHYPNLPAVRDPTRTVLPSSAGSRTGWADRRNEGLTPSAAPAASRTSRGLSSHPTSTDTSAPEPQQTKGSGSTEELESQIIIYMWLCVSSYIL